ncbi:uncharacterized protein EDB93DRAFT_1181492 [Suillus bovinus]|uniref:uncharacterized protein n=1 Tax=Suillus bovinus TaxID=48563 RepID=UPI001B879E81|nr:uncharacterized protein EDB93DRAFT_1181492 [Suillus bovinus]KAG2129813.1 hypothetical protein EDB93DRAFT_1181492 [Suillus bovinus]
MHICIKPAELNNSGQLRTSSVFFTNSSRLIMPINTSPRAILTSFFVLLTLLSCALCAPVPAVMRRDASDIWIPRITSPTSHTKWTVGGTFLVTWDGSSAPPHVTNTIGEVYLRHGGGTQDNPIASGFSLHDGKVYVTVPHDTTPGKYQVVCEYLVLRYLDPES